MPVSFDLSGLRFLAPAMLPLLLAPALLLLVWMWQAWRRHGDVTQMRRHRQLPTRHSTATFAREAVFSLEKRKRQP